MMLKSILQEERGGKMLDGDSMRGVESILRLLVGEKSDV